MARMAIVTDVDRCVGCHACTVACKVMHEMPVGRYWNRVLRIGPNPKEGGSGNWPDVEMYFLNLSCQHCATPECVSVCPTGATTKAENGTVQIDPNVCIGCGTCRNSCPYDAPRIDASAGVCHKCDGCLARVRDGKEPMCVGSCPLRALEFGPIEELREKYGDCAQVPPMATPATRPNIVIGTCQAVDSETYNLDEGYVANPLEVE